MFHYRVSSYFYKFPDLTIKVNSFNDYKKICCLIKPTGHITFHALQMLTSPNLIHKWLNELRKEFKANLMAIFFKHGSLHSLALTQPYCCRYISQFSFVAWLSMSTLARTVVRSLSAQGSVRLLQYPFSPVFVRLSRQFPTTEHVPYVSFIAYVFCNANSRSQSEQQEQTICIGKLLSM